MAALDTIQQFLIEIDVDADLGELIAFENRLNSVDRALTKVSFAARTIALNLAGMTATMVGSEVVMGGVAAAGTAVTGIVSKMVTQTARQARATEVSVDRLQKLRFALQGHNVKAEKAVDVISSLVDTQQGAIEGTKSDVEAWQKLGLSIDQVRGRKPWELFEIVSDRVQDAKDQQKTLVAVQDIFGEGLGSNLMPMLQQGSSGFREMGRTMEDLGAILDQQTVEQFEKLHTQGFQLWTIIRGMARTFAKTLLPNLLAITESIEDWVKANEEIIKQELQEWARFTVNALREVKTTFNQIESAVSALGGVRNILNGLGDTIGILTTAMLTAFGTSFIATIKQASTTIGALTIEFVASAAAAEGFELSIDGLRGALIGLRTTMLSFLTGFPILIALFAALFLIFEDIWTFLEGGRSLTGVFVDFASSMGGVKGLVNDVLNQLDAWLELIESIVPSIETWNDVLVALAFTFATVFNVIVLFVRIAVKDFTILIKKVQLFIELLKLASALGRTLLSFSFLQFGDARKSGDEAVESVEKIAELTREAAKANVGQFQAVGQFVRDQQKIGQLFRRSNIQTKTTPNQSLPPSQRQSRTSGNNVTVNNEVSVEGVQDQQEMIQQMKRELDKFAKQTGREVKKNSSNQR